MAGFGISWLEVAWAMVWACLLCMASMHVLMATRTQGRARRAHLMIVVIALSAALTGVFELLLARSNTIEQYARLLRAIHVPVALLVVGVSAFIAIHLRSGRRWLAIAPGTLWGVALVINFRSPFSRVYSNITSLEHVPAIGGDVFTTATGSPHPLRWVSQVGTLLLLAFVADASVTLWRRGERRRAVVIGGSTALSVALALGHTTLVQFGAVRSPYMISVAFLVLAAGMSFELVHEALRAETLGDEVEVQRAAILEQQERLQRASEVAQLGFWSWSEGEDTIWASPGVHEQLGLESTDGFTRASALDLVHPDDRPAVLVAARRAAQGEDVVAAEFRVLRSDGAVRQVAVSGRFETGQGGRRAKGVTLDVTRRRELEVDFETQRAAIAHLSRVGTFGEVSQSIAHELRQPLASILTNAQAGLRFLAQDPIDPEELRGLLEAIIHQDRFAADVTNRLRLLLRGEGSNGQSLNLNRVVEEAARLTVGRLGREGVQTSLQLGDKLPPVAGDPVLLLQILVNLLRNASEAMADIPVGDRHVAIRTVARDGGAEIVVTDRGRGIPAENLERMFEPFFTTRRGGTGLGLALARTLAHLQGGRIWATAPADRPGASIHVFLPAHGGRTRDP